MDFLGSSLACCNSPADIAVLAKLLGVVRQAVEDFKTDTVGSSKYSTSRYGFLGFIGAATRWARGAASGNTSTVTPAPSSPTAGASSPTAAASASASSSAEESKAKYEIISSSISGSGSGSASVDEPTGTSGPPAVESRECAQMRAKAAFLEQIFKIDEKLKHRAEEMEHSAEALAATSKEYGNSIGNSNNNSNAGEMKDWQRAFMNSTSQDEWV